VARLGMLESRRQRPLQTNNYFTEICSGSEAGSYLRRIDCITQLVSLNSRLESDKEEEERPLPTPERERDRQTYRERRERDSQTERVSDSWVPNWV